MERYALHHLATRQGVCSHPRYTRIDLITDSQATPGPSTKLSDHLFYYGDSLPQSRDTLAKEVTTAQQLHPTAAKARTQRTIMYSLLKANASIQRSHAPLSLTVSLYHPLKTPSNPTPVQKSHRKTYLTSFHLLCPYPPAHLSPTIFATASTVSPSTRSFSLFNSRHSAFFTQS